MLRTRYELKESQTQVKTIKPQDQRQAEILANMYYAACSFIGGLENTTYDYPETDEEYINAAKTLKDHAGLVDEVEDMCCSGFYGCGIEGPQYAYQKHYNLAGKKYISECAEAVVKSMGY